jgi:hypothetical protein
MRTLLLEDYPFRYYDKAKTKVNERVDSITLMNHVTFMLMVIHYMEKRGLVSDSVAEGFDNNIHSRNGILEIDCNNLEIDSSLFTDEGNRIIDINYKRWLKEYEEKGYVTFPRY